MLKSYLRSSLRNLWRHKGHSLINIIGLAIGMACVILILLYVKSELSYDQFHEKKDQIYLLKIQTTNPQSGAENKRAIGPYRLADELRVDFPDFESVIRFAPQSREAIEVGAETYYEENLTFVDPEIFSAFTFPLIKGNPNIALSDPHSLVLTKGIASKYFGSEDPIGKTVRIRDTEFSITGIMADVPDQSQFGFDILVSMNCAPNLFSRIVLENWGEGYVWTFVTLPPEKEPADFRSRLEDFVAAKLEAWKAFSPVLAMHPLTDLYLDSQDISGFAPGGDRTYVVAFSFIALFILIIACINFINLATARSSLRAKEVGLRKVVGAERKQLIGQFLSESTILAFICLLIAICLVWISIGKFNQLADRQIALNLIGDPAVSVGLLLLTLFVGLIAGSYPAILLSGYDPVQVLSGKLNVNMKGMSLRRILVTFQFLTSIFLIIITAVVYQQIQYCKNIDLGFDKEQLLVLGTPLSLRERYDQFRNELIANPKIINAAGSSRVPPGSLSSSLRARPEGVPENQQRGMQTVWTDYDFIETMGFELVSGRSFSRDFPADASNAFILNEAAVKEIGWTNESAIDKTFGSSEIKDWNSGQWENRNGKVIGVLRDFHFESLKDKIVPTVYFIAPYMAWNYVIRVAPGDLSESISHINRVWEKFNPEQPFEFTFVDSNFAELYANEERQGKIFAIFASLAIFIACLGLIGLASFTAQRRKKEISIRKVLGASSTSLIYLLSKEFTLLVIIAFLIAVPLAYYVSSKWLESFVYRTSIGFSVFLFAGLTALLIAWITVGYQTARAALDSPVNSMREV